PVSPVNDAPDARDDSSSAKGGETIRIAVLGNDRDIDGDPLRIVAINGVSVTVGRPVSIANGTLVLNNDGTISFTPDSGYSGTLSFTYTVTDGNGGFDTASVVVDVSAGYIEIDPPFSPPQSQDGLGPLVSADGMIASSIGDLNSTVLDARGMIDGVANSIRYLNGISGLSVDGVVEQVVQQVDRWAYAEERLAQVSDTLFDGGSARMSSGGDSGAWFSVETIVRDGVLHVSVLSSDSGRGALAGGGQSITLADGRALPGWIELASGGVLVGRPPAGLPFLDLKIQATDKDNRTVADTVRIDLLTGAVVSHGPDQRADAGGMLFSSQTMAGFERSIEQANSLASALNGWSALRDETRLAS
ncbi:MAG: cadherin-like domain-containing protein, partial [Rhizobiaceae bacterium]|nr:cadherin-like domain-containing protein [Rhizobiaceae bacterium]